METRPSAMLAAALLLLAEICACSSQDSDALQGGFGGTAGTGPSGSDANPGNGAADAERGSDVGNDAGPSNIDASLGGGGLDAASGADTTSSRPSDSEPAVADAKEVMGDVMGADGSGTVLPPGVPPGYRLLLDESFASAGSLAAILAGNPQDWTHGVDDGGFLQFGGAGYAPPNPPVPESFTSFALVSALRFGSFVLEVELMQRNPDQAIPQRDLCIVFGIVSETEYYYAHIAQGHTDRWHNIHIIDNAPRRPITKTDNGGISWGLNRWHTFRLVRDVVIGNIEVFMDGGMAPILTAIDTTFKEGYVGFATHQDSGRIRNLKVWGPSATAAPAPANFFTAR